MALWHSLYLPCDSDNTTPSVSRVLQETLVSLGYTLYNPFGLIPGKAYAETVKLFVSPAQDGWIRILSAADCQPAELQPGLSTQGLCLYMALDGDSATIRVLVNQAESTPETAFAPYLSSSAANLDHALHSAELRVVPNQPSPETSAFAILPDDMQSLAGQIDKKQAEKMFARLSKNLMGRAGGDADAANRLLAGEGAPNWDSPGGRRISAVMDCLTVPANWREPDFTSLRDAYQLHERRRRNPQAMLYPGDAEAMAKVENALEYTPVYGGK